MTKDEVVAAGINPDDPGNREVYTFSAHIAIGSDNLSLNGSMSAERALRLRRQRRAELVLGRRRGRDGLRVPELRGRRAAAAVARDPGPHRVPEGVLPGLDGRAEPRVRRSSRCKRRERRRSTCPPGSRSRRPRRRSRRASRCPTSRAAATRGRPGSCAATARATTSRAPATPRTLDPIDLPVALEARLAQPLHVYGASAMQVVVDTDDRYDDRYPAPRPRRHPQHVAGDDQQRRAGDPGRGRQGLRRPAAAAARVVGGEHRAGRDLVPGRRRRSRRRLHPRARSRSGNVDLGAELHHAGRGRHVRHAPGPRDAHAGAARRASAPELSAVRRGGWLVSEVGRRARGRRATRRSLPRAARSEFGTTPLAATDAQTPGAARAASIPAGAHRGARARGAGRRRSSRSRRSRRRGSCSITRWPR